MASSKLIQLYATMSAPVFLFANESNHTLLQSLLEIINAIIENQYDSKLIQEDVPKQELTYQKKMQSSFTQSSDHKRDSLRYEK